jgi:hypothetical protein
LPIHIANAAIKKTTQNESNIPFIGRLRSLFPAKRVTSAMMNSIAILPQADASSIFEGIEIVGRYEPNAHKSNKGIDNITTTQSSTKSF